MPDGFRPFGLPSDEQLKAWVRAAIEGAADASGRLREELARAGIAVPPSQLGQTDEDRPELTDSGDLTQLRDAAEPLVDGTDGTDRDASVVLAALTSLDRIRVIVERELGHDWRGKVRPFGTIARRKGARVGAAWVGDGDVEPVSLADAVELLAVDRAQFRREADDSRTRAGEAVATVGQARREAYDAKAQVTEIRDYLESVLRPNAHTDRWCEDCQDAPHGERCLEHREDEIEPELPERLVDAIRALVVRWRTAEGREREARQGRVSVYVDGQLVTGPPVVADAAPERPRVKAVEWRVVRPGEEPLTIARVTTPEYSSPYGWHYTDEGVFTFGDGGFIITPPWRFERRTLGWTEREPDEGWQVLAQSTAPGDG